MYKRQVTTDVSGGSDNYYYYGKESGTIRYSVYENSNNVYINTWGGMYLRANQHGGSGGGLGASGAVFNAANGLSIGTYSSTSGGSANGRLQLYGSTANKQADLYCSNGNLHIDADNGNGIYLNWYGTQSATSTAGTYFGNANAGQVARIDGSGNLTLSGTVDGVDIAARDSVLTSTTTTANAALPKAGGTMTGNLTIDYTGNATNDAGLYVANDNSDWGIYVNKDGTGTYGIKIAADGAYPFQITNSSGTEKFRVDADGDIETVRNIELDGTITGNGSGLTSLNASNLSSGTIDSDRLATGASGNWWAGNVVKVRTDGVMEIGKYIDFHNTDTATSDFDVRLQVHSTNNLSISGSGRIFHDGYHPNADTLTTARTIAGTSFNGSANIDISYNNLTNKPTIPTNNNQLTNGAGYITSSGTAANATQAGGLSVHSGRNNEANKIVRTDANGYIQAGWINTTSGSTTTAIDRIYASNDGYIRYYTPANFLNSGGFGDHLFNNQAQVHSSSTNFNTSMSAGVHYMQQGTNGPTGTTSHQFYGVKFGLGSDYSSSSAYSSQMYYPRADQGGGNGLYFRDMENGSWGSWRQVDAGTVGTLALKSGSGATGANQILRSHSNNYLYHQSWIDIGEQGLFSSSINGFHFYPNQLGSYGTARLNGTRGGYSGLMMDGGGDVVTGMFDGSGNGGDYNASSGWHYYYHRSNDCLGISGSTTSSSYGLYVSGAIYATADIVGSSDERLKTEIKTIPNALDKVLKLRGVTYKWIDPEEGGTCVNNITETRMGVIAQEVVNVVPEVVTHDKENDRYGVSYGHLTGVLIEAVKELKQEVNELKKELEEVKNG